MIKLSNTNTPSWRHLLLTGAFLCAFSACGGGGGSEGGGGTIPDPTPDPDPVPEVTTGQVSFVPSWGSLPVPKSLRFHFYPSSGAVATKDVDGQGVNVALEAGAYKVLAYNTDATGVSFEGVDGYESARVCVKPLEVASRAATSLLAQPSAVYLLAWDALTVEKGGTHSDSPTPRQLTHTINLTFNVTNASFISSLTGYMNGLLPSLLLSTGEADDAVKGSAKDNGILFEVSMSGSTGTASYTTLGLLNPEKGAAYSCLLMLSATTTDGQEWETVADLTSVVSEVFEKNGGKLPENQPLSLELRVNATTAGVNAQVTGWRVGPSGGSTLTP